MPDLDDDVVAAARAAARAVAGKYPGAVEYEDLVQDALVWVLSHEPRVEHARLDDGRLYMPQLISEIIGPLARHAKGEKRRALGMNPRDQLRYQRRTVEAALPVVWDPHYRPELPEMSRGRKDPALRGNWEATAVDVKRAVEAVCSTYEERLLFVRYGMAARSARETGYFTGVPREQVEPEIVAIVGRLVDWLNDDVTPPNDVGPEDYTGSRQVISNAQAQATAAAQYGG